MHSDIASMFWKGMQIIAFGLTFLAPLFQIFKLVKEKNSKTVSLGSWLCFLAFGFLMLIDIYLYDQIAGPYKKISDYAFPLFFLLENIIVVGFIVKYRQKSHLNSQ